MIQSRSLYKVRMEAITTSHVILLKIDMADQETEIAEEEQIAETRETKTLIRILKSM